MFDDFQLGLIQSPNITLMGDGTFKYVTNVFSQQYTFHLQIWEQRCSSFVYLMRIKNRNNVCLFESEFQDTEIQKG